MGVLDGMESSIRTGRLFTYAAAYYVIMFVPALNAIASDAQTREMEPLPVLLLTC